MFFKGETCILSCRSQRLNVVFAFHFFFKSLLFHMSVVASFSFFTLDCWLFLAYFLFICLIYRCIPCYRVTKNYFSIWWVVQRAKCIVKWTKQFLHCEAWSRKKITKLNTFVVRGLFKFYVDINWSWLVKCMQWYLQTQTF